MVRICKLRISLSCLAPILSCDFETCCTWFPFKSYLYQWFLVSYLYDAPSKNSATRSPLYQYILVTSLILGGFIIHRSYRCHSQNLYKVALILKGGWSPHETNFKIPILTILRFFGRYHLYHVTWPLCHLQYISSSILCGFIICKKIDIYV